MLSAPTGAQISAPTGAQNHQGAYGSSGGGGASGMMQNQNNQFQFGQQEQLQLQLQQSLQFQQQQGNQFNPMQPNNGPAAAPLFSVSQLQAMRTAVHQNQMNSAGASAMQTQPPSCNSSGMDMRQNGSGPFMVLTQVPVQATPFASLAGGYGVAPQQQQHQQQQQQQQQQQAQPSYQQASFQQNQPQRDDPPQQLPNSSVPAQQHWAQLLQPAPVPLQQQQQLQPQQQQQLQPQQQQQLQPQQQQHLQPQQQQHLQPQQSPNNSGFNQSPARQQNPNDTNALLQQLMKNAFAAQQQPVQVEAFESGGSLHDSLSSSMSMNSGMTGGKRTVSQQQQSLYTIGSNVEPVQRTAGPGDGGGDGGSNGNLISDSVLWKQLWEDDDDDKMPTAVPGLVSTGSNLAKRKFSPEASQPEPIAFNKGPTGPTFPLRENSREGTPSTRELKPQPQTTRAPMPLPPMPAVTAAQYQQLRQQQRQQQQQQQQQPDQGSVQVQQSNSMEDDDMSEDMAPTPLCEIRAKHFKMMVDRQEQDHKQQQTGHPPPTSPASSMRSAPSPMLVSRSTPTGHCDESVDGSTASAGPALTEPSNASNMTQQMLGIQEQLQNQQQQQEQEKLKRAGKPPLTPVLPAPFLLPSTMMPPSVLASVMNKGSSKPASSTSSSGRYKKRTGTKSVRVESPQDVLERILSLRGYGSNNRVKAEQASYDTMPSALQLASFGTELVKAIHTSDADKLSKLLSAGLSANPCNQFRDSIVDLVCKRANLPIFRCLVEHDCELRVCDGFGRTPLHHCAWASEFSKEIAEMILEKDWIQLLIEDKRGQTPLEYVRPDQASAWIDFLEDNKDRYFPAGGSVPVIPNLKEMRPESSLPDPPNSLPVPLAAAVSAGQVSPEEVAKMDADARASFRS